MTIQEIIKNHIMGEIFSEFPTDLEQHQFDFFMSADVDENMPLHRTGLAEFGYELCEAYELEDEVGSVRGLMQSMYDSLDSLRGELFQYAVKSVMVSKEVLENENEFYDFIQDANATLHRQGTADEYATVLTVDAEAVL